MEMNVSTSMNKIQRSERKGRGRKGVTGEVEQGGVDASTSRLGGRAKGQRGSMKPRIQAAKLKKCEEHIWPLCNASESQRRHIGLLSFAM